MPLLYRGRNKAQTSSEEVSDYTDRSVVQIVEPGQFCVLNVRQTLFSHLTHAGLSIIIPKTYAVILKPVVLNTHLLPTSVCCARLRHTYFLLQSPGI